MSGFSSFSRTGKLNSAFLVYLLVLVLNVIKAIIDTHKWTFTKDVPKEKRSSLWDLTAQP